MTWWCGFWLRTQGEALMFAPMRGKTFDQFADIAQASFTVEKEQHYDDHIWNLHTQVGCTHCLYREQAGDNCRLYMGPFKNPQSHGI